MSINSCEEARHKEAQKEHNRCRVTKAKAALTGYGMNEDVQDDIVDLLADLGHLCAHEGFEFSALIRRAKNHVAEETVSDEL